MRFILLFLPLFLVACSTTATLKKTNGRAVEARIESSDRETVFVELPLVQQTAPIPRAQIYDIDHPGNVHLLIGSIFSSFGVMAGGLATLALLADDTHTNLVAIPLGFSGIVYLAIGLPMGVWGYKTWIRSKNAVDSLDVEKQPNRVVWGPKALSRDGEFVLGVGAGGSF